MSDLQLSLLALGAVIIAAVILFNWWQERRFMQESSRRFEGPADNALMDEFRIDPEPSVGFETEHFVADNRFDEDPVVTEDAMLEDLHRSLPPEAEPLPQTVAEPIAPAPAAEPVAAAAAIEAPLVMPEPEAPISATISPRSMVNDTPLRTGTSISPRWYVFVRLTTRISSMRFL